MAELLADAIGALVPSFYFDPNMTEEDGTVAASLRLLIEWVGRPLQAGDVVNLIFEDEWTGGWFVEWIDRSKGLARVRNG